MGTASLTSRRFGIAELAWIALLGGVIVGEVWASRTTFAFRAPLRLDEFHTYLVGTQPGLAAPLASLSRGADYNPPGMYVLLKLYALAVGDLNEETLRVFSFACVLSGLAGLYLLLREGASRGVVLAACLATWAHPLLVAEAFDARFYAPWFACVAWFALCLRKSLVSPTLRWHAGLAVSTALTCTMHYFGVISVGLVWAAQALTAGSQRSNLLRSIPWVVAGTLSLALCVPLYLGQRAALSVPTWVKPLRWEQVPAFVATFFPALLFAPVAILAVVGGLFTRAAVEEGNGDKPGMSGASVAGLLGLALMPFALLLFSFLVQPAAVARYAIPTVLCVGPVVARLLRTVPRGVVAAAVLYYAAAGGLALHSGFDRTDELLRHRLFAEVTAISDRDGPQALFLYDSRDLAYQTWRYAGPGPRVRLLNQVQGSGEGVDNRVRLEEDVANRLGELYGTPAVAAPADLVAARSLYVVSSFPDTLPRLRRQHPEYGLEILFDSNEAFPGSARIRIARLRRGD